MTDNIAQWLVSPSVARTSLIGLTRLFGALRSLSAMACKPPITARTRKSAVGHKQPSRARQRASAVRPGAEIRCPNVRSWRFSRRSSRCAERPLIAEAVEELFRGARDATIFQKILLLSNYNAIWRTILYYCCAPLAHSGVLQHPQPGAEKWGSIAFDRFPTIADLGASVV